MRLILVLVLAAIAPVHATARQPYGPGFGGSAGSFTGPGSPGFLATCSTVANINNFLLQTSTFSTSNWTTAATGSGTAPTLTANAAVAPDSTTTAARLALSAIPSGTGSSSTVYQGATVDGNFLSGAVWMRGEAGGEKVVLAVTPDGTNFTYTWVTLTTTWQQVSVNNWQGNAGTMYFEIGVDQRVPTAAGSYPAATIDIWHPQINYGPDAAVPYLASTTTAASGTATLNCPASLAFRDFSTLTYNATAGPSGNGHVWPQNTGAYNSGGVSNPYFYTGAKIGSTYYALANSTTSADHNGWHTQILYSGDGMYSWTDAGLGNPVITGTAGTWNDHYLLHGSMAPSCSLATWCYYYSAMTSASVSSIGVATSSDLVHWTQYSGNPVITATQNGSANDPSLPSIVQVGSTLHMCSSQGDNFGMYLVRWQAPTSNTATWTWGGQLLGHRSGDWDDTVAGMIDCFWFQNSHGFYEIFYTALFSSSQKIGYAVAQCPTCRVFKRQDAPIITSASPATPQLGEYIGDVVAYENAGLFIITMTYDNATNTSFGFVATMTDH